MDLSNITFNKDHKLEAAAKDAATGIRLMTLAFIASGVAFGLAMLASASHDLGALSTVVSLAFSIIALGAGAYGAYLAASALDWAGYITGVIVLGAIIPYLKFACFVVLMAFSIDLVRKAKYSFSFFGPLGRREPA